MLKVFRPIVLGFCLAMSATAVFSITVTVTGTDAEPEPGMWGVDGEVNNKPGRGFQIDSQAGKVLIVSYFGYRADGSALFLQSSGEMVTETVGGNLIRNFEGDLAEYKNGTVLAGPRTDGELAALPGKLKITFETATTGVVTLPGEQPKRISRYQYEDPLPRFNLQKEAYFWGVMTSAPFLDPSPLIQTYRFTAKNGAFTMKRDNGQETCTYSGNYSPAGRGLYSTGTYECANSYFKTNESGTYRSGPLVINERGIFTGTIYRTRQNDIGTQLEDHYGVCVPTGFVIGGGPFRCNKF